LEIAADLKRMLARRRRQSALLIGVFISILMVIISEIGLLQRANFWFSDLLYTQVPLSGNIVIVGIDDVSLARYGRSLTTWPRSLYADLVKTVSEAGARVITFDILFSQPARGDTAFQMAIEAARRTGARTRTVLGAALPETGNGEFLRPTAALADAADYIGHTNVSLDADSAIRRFTPFKQFGQEQVPALSTATLLAYLRIPASAVDQVVQGPNDGTLILAQKRIPLDYNDEALINFAGPTGTFPVVSFHDVLSGLIPPETFAGKIVLVGVYGSAGDTDRYFVPLSRRGEPMSGVEIHANAVEMLIENRFLRPAHSLITAASILGITLLGVFLFTAGSWPFAVMSYVGLLGGGFFLASAAFSLIGLVVNLFYPLVALSIAFLGTVGLCATSEVRLRLNLQRLLNALSTLMTGQQSPDEVLQRAGEALVDQFAFRRTYLWRWAPSEPTLNLRYRSPGAPPPTPEHSRLAEAVAQSQQVAVHGQWVAVPLISERQLYGVLLAEEGPLRLEERMAILTMFAERLAPAYANASLYRAMQELDILKTQMLRMASHDLRNPLMLISGYTDILELSATPDQQEMINIIRDATKRMLAIIRDVLDIEQVRSGKFEMAPFGFDEMVAALALEYEVHAQQANHTFVVEMPNDEIHVNGNRAQLREAVSNLLSNAMKYTPPGGTITLRLVAKDGRAILSVTDTGYGIPPEGQKSLFQPFYRVKSAETADIPGTGLGLSLVKAVVEAHGGRISFETAVGKGSTFTIDLPLISEKA
jgi:signal transduction histidine kinase